MFKLKLQGDVALGEIPIALLLSQRVDNGVVTLLLIIVAPFLSFIPFVY